MGSGYLEFPPLRECKMKRVAIVSTGAELMQGRIQDENGAFLSAQLFATDCVVVMHIAVGDVLEDIEYALRRAAERADIVLITGGLGPTDDDYTVEAIQRLYGIGQIIDEHARAEMEDFFGAMKAIPAPCDIKMAAVPAGAVIFDNETGLAPGFAIERGETCVIAMPGVPREMRDMFGSKVMPYLVARWGVGERRYFCMRVILLREAEVNERVRQMRVPFDALAWGITTTPGMNVVTFVQKGETPFPRDVIMSEAVRIFGRNMLSEGAVSLEEELVHILGEKNATLAVAESCTGGLIGRRITDIPGSSKVFSGGVVAYSNEAKIRLLSVSPDVLRYHGAVSEETAAAMAHGARMAFDSDLAVATTGIAGPGGGTEIKPVGTVCFAFAHPGGVDTFTRVISGERERVRFIASQIAMDIVRLHVQGI